MGRTVSLHDASPKIKVITENLVETSHVVRSKAVEFDATMGEANRRARTQMATIDGMITQDAGCDGGDHGIGGTCGAGAGA